MSDSKHLFFLMSHVFWGFALCVFYGIASAFIVWIFYDINIFEEFTRLFFRSFNGVVVGGLIASISILVWKSQDWIPDLIESNFPYFATSNPDFIEAKRRYLSASRSISFSTQFIIAGFFIFYLCNFPLAGVPKMSLLVYACIQYGLGVYVGRKLFYIAQMINCLDNVDIKSDIFTEDKLGMMIIYVNSISTLTAIFVYLHVYCYYNGPFLFDGVVKDAPRIALLLPAVLAAPVIVIFNFYPRTVLRRLYEKSISRQIEQIKEKLTSDKITEIQRLTYIIEYDKMSRAELKHRLRISLSDLPIAISSAAAVIALLLR